MSRKNQKAIRRGYVYVTMIRGLWSHDLSVMDEWLKMKEIYLRSYQIWMRRRKKHRTLKNRDYGRIYHRTKHDYEQILEVKRLAKKLARDRQEALRMMEARKNSVIF